MPFATEQDDSSPALAVQPLSHPVLSSKTPDLSSRLLKARSRKYDANKGDKTHGQQPAQHDSCDERQNGRRPIPTPATPELSIPPVNPHFDHPTRRILTPNDHTLFMQSSTHEMLLAFAFGIADSLRGIDMKTAKSQAQHSSITSLLEILDQTQEVLEKTPAGDNGGSRFGNPVFRIFLAAVDAEVDVWHQSKLNINSAAPLDELHTYYLASFGSPLRIDYGSGHELNFLVYLLCLNRLGLLPASTFPQLGLVLFPRYLQLMRKIQGTYYLEPAGSHGVWGLDDYHFLPFLFGASQLTSHPFIRPLAIHSDATIDAYADEFLYLDMVRHVNSTKTVQGLRWHSPMLDDISGVKQGWGRIADGMKKMFVREILGKLVVMQHFLFGGLIPAVAGMSEDGDVDVEEHQSQVHAGHAHNVNSWGDCCGIKVPSSVGASEELRKHAGNGGLRRLPFD